MGRALLELLEAIGRGGDSMRGHTSAGVRAACRGTEHYPSCWSSGEKLFAVVVAVVVIWFVVGWLKGKDKK